MGTRVAGWRTGTVSSGYEAAVANALQVREDLDAVRIVDVTDSDRLARSSRRFAAVTGAASLAGGLVVLFGWTFGIPALKTGLTGLSTMKPNSALCFMLCGASLWLHSSTRATARAGLTRPIAAALGALAALIGLTTMVEYVSGFAFGVDTILFPEAVRAESWSHPGRMAGATALNFVLMGGALTVLDVEPRRMPLAIEMLVLPGLVIALVAIVGYLFEVSPLYSFTRYASIALPTAVIFAWLGTGVLASRPERGLASLVTADHGGGWAARVLLPLAIIAPILVGELRWQGERAGWYGMAMGIALFTIALSAIFASLIVFLAYRLDRFNRERNRATRLVEIQNRALERIATGAPLTETVSQLLEELEKLDPEMLTSVLLMSDDGTRVRHCAAPRLPAAYMAALDGARIGPAAGSCGTAAWRRQQVVVSDITRDPLWNDYRALASEHGLRACWSTPIFGTDAILLGTFAIYYREPKEPEPKHQRTIEAIAHTVAIAIDRARAAQTLIQKEAHLEAAQQHGNIGSWEVELGAPRGRWSRQLYRIVGRDPTLPASTLNELLDLVHPDDKASVEDVLSHPERLHAQRRLDFRIVSPVVGARDLWATVDLVRAADGKPVGMAGTVLDVTERKAAEHSIERSLSRQRDLSRRLAQAEEEERRSIGRELHDRIGADLAAVKLNLDLVCATLPAETAPAVNRRLADTHALVQSAIVHTRNILAELRPPGLDDYGLLAALEMHAGALEERLGIPVAVTGANVSPALPHVAETALFRIVQEALNNAAKHAAASSIDIELTQDANNVRLTVSDDGVGFAPSGATGAGYGLRTMRERGDAINASINIDSAPGKGTRVEIRLERET